MPTEDTTNSSGGSPFAPDRNREVTLEFQHEAKEIEDLIVSCIAEHHCACSSSEIQSLIQEWKALYRRKIGEDITEDEFATTEIGRFILNHQIYDKMKKMV